MSEPLPIRRALGFALIGSLCVAALTAIVALLSGSFDDTDWRVIGTSASFAIYSALAASGASVRLKEHPAAQPLGVVTVGAAAIAFVLVLVLIWGDGEDAVARSWGVATIVALACSHASVVLRGTRADDTAAVSALVTASIAFAAIDAIAGALAVADLVAVDDDDPLVRLMAITVVLLLLTTALPPVLRRLQPRAAAVAWPAPRGASLERLAREVVAATERIERLDDPSAVRDECRRLRDLARNLGG